MAPFETFTGLVVPIDRANVDTDAILPKQFMKSVKRTGFGAYLFDAWRFLDPGEIGMQVEDRRPDPAFALNQPRYAGASILLTRGNFGCGSSREHAPWALADFGIRVLVAPSFADIFRTNCLKNGLLPIVLADTAIDALFRCVDRLPGFALSVDLAACTITGPDGMGLPFAIDPTERERLLNGQDEIALTLAIENHIDAYEHRRRIAEPWLFDPS